MKSYKIEIEVTYDDDYPAPNEEELKTRLEAGLGITTDEMDYVVEEYQIDIEEA